MFKYHMCWSPLHQQVSANSVIGSVATQFLHLTQVNCQDLAGYVTICKGLRVYLKSLTNAEYTDGKAVQDYISIAFYCSVHVRT